MSKKEDIYEFKAIPVKEIYYNEDSSWGTYKVETNDNVPHFNEQDSFSSNTKFEGRITGKMQQLTLGEEYNVTGTIATHEQYGSSINPITVTPDVPKTLETQKKFLEAIITKHQATVLLEKYPNIVESIIEGNDLVDFDELDGIGETTYDKIKTKVIDNFVISDILALLSPLGVTFKMIKKLTESEPNSYLLKKKLKDNPYILTNIEGLGFSKVDILALKINPKLKHSNFRAVSYIQYYLSSMGDNDGHEWVDNLILKRNFMNNVPECEDLYEGIINEQRRLSTFLHIEKERIGLKSRYMVEESIANRLIAISECKSTIEISEENIKRGIAKANAFQGFTYDEGQEKTIREAVKRKITVIHGVAGSSKTSTARGILNVLADAGCSIGACALSAKAGIVIKESTGFPASTIHRMFGIGRPKKIKDNESGGANLIIDVLLTDEASMTNSYLFNYMLTHIHDSTIVIIVGDDKQLPSIGYGSVLRDLISIGSNDVFNLITLNKIYRQALASGIIKDANLIRCNKMPFDQFKTAIVSGELKDMFYIFLSKKEEIHQQALEKYFSAVKKEGIENVCILAPMKEGINGINSFNTEIQEELLAGQPSIVVGEIKFRLGARVMQTKNNYDENVMNGESGIIIDIDDKGCEIKFDDKSVRYTKSELGQIQLAYACSVHKKQGDSINTCILVLDRSHFILLDACLLYTGITRAKSRCLVISDTSAFKRCIETNNQIDRQTYLKRILLNKIKDRNSNNQIK